MDPVDDSNTLPGIRRNLLAGAQDGTLGYWKAARVLDSYLEGGTNALLNQEAWEAFTSVPIGPDARRRAWDARLILMLSDSMSLYAKTAGKDQKEAILGNPRNLAQALVWTWLTRSTWAVPDPDPALIAKVVSATVKRISPVLRKHLDAALEAALECKDPWRLEVAQALRKELPWEFLSASYPEDDTLNAARMVEGSEFHLPHSHPGSRITVPFGDYLPRLIQAVLARNLSRVEAQQRWERAVRLWDEEMAAGRAPFEKFYLAKGFLEGIPSKTGVIADPDRFVRLWLALTLDTAQCIYPRDLQMLVPEVNINHELYQWSAIMAGLPVGRG